MVRCPMPVRSCRYRSEVLQNPEKDYLVVMGNWSGWMKLRRRISALSMPISRAAMSSKRSITKRRAAALHRDTVSRWVCW